MISTASIQMLARYLFNNKAQCTIISSHTDIPCTNKLSIFIIEPEELRHCKTQLLVTGPTGVL